MKMLRNIMLILLMLNVSTKQNTKSFNEHCLINNKEEAVLPCYNLQK